MAADIRKKSEDIPNPANHVRTGRHPEDRDVSNEIEDIRQRTFDKTLADSYPASDPPSSIPDPCPEEPADAQLHEELNEKKDNAA